MEIHSFINYPTHPQQAYPNQVAFLTTVHYVTTGAFCSKISYHLLTTTGLTCTFASAECDSHYCSWFEKFFYTTSSNISSRKFGVFVSQVNKLLRIFVLQSKKIDYLLGCYHKHTTCTCTCILKVMIKLFLIIGYLWLWMMNGSHMDDTLMTPLLFI